MSKLKENLIALAGAIVLTGIFIFFINNSGANFATDVLWKPANTIDTDLVAVPYSWQLIIKSNKEIDNVASMTFQIAYNPQKIHLTKDSFDSQFDLTSQQISTGNVYIMLTNINQIRKGETILKIKGITKDNIVNINFGHIQVIDNNWNVVDLTISK